MCPTSTPASPLVVTARLPQLAGDVVVRGNLAGEPWSATLALDAVRSGTGIATVWARRKIEVLMDAERRGDTNAQREIVEIASRHRLASRYTSFVAVDRTPVRPLQAALAASRRSEPAARRVVGGWRRLSADRDACRAARARESPALRAGGGIAHAPPTPGISILRHRLRAVGAVLLSLASWQAGAALYIPAKAWLAQRLLERRVDANARG